MSSPTLQQIRTAIAARISGVAGTGQVYDRERYASDMGALKALYLSDGTIKGWFIRRRATDENYDAIGRSTVVHRWDVRAYQAFDDPNSSEIAFDNMIESVRDAFRVDDGLGGVIATVIVDGVIGLQVADAGPVLFGGVLCHGARCALATEHFL